MAQASRDQNNVPTLIAVSNADGVTPVAIYADPTTHRLLVDLSSGSGTVTSVSVVTANGFAGSVADATTTPAITLTTTVTGILSGNGTAVSAASTTGSGAVVLATSSTLVTPDIGTPSAGVLTNCTGYTVANISGLGANVATFLATPSSANLAAAVTGETGSGALVFATSPALVTPDIGTPSAGVLTNCTGYTVANISGLGTGVATALAINVGSAGAVVVLNGALGTPSSGTLTNCTGLPVATGISGMGADVATFLATPSSTNLAAAVTGETGSGALVFGTAPTLSGAVQLAEGASVRLDAAGSADGAFSGITISGTAGATLAFGDLVYLAAADSRWELADADAASTSGDVIIAMCVLAAASDGDPTVLLLYGNIRADAAFPALTIGAPAYVSTTAGDIQTAQPSGTDDVIRRVGFALTADELLFNPSNDYVTHV